MKGTKKDDLSREIGEGDREFARLKTLVRKSDLKKPIYKTDIRSVFEQIAVHLKESAPASQKVWRIILRLGYENKEIAAYNLQICNGKYEILEKTPENFDLEIFVHRDSWWEIVKGELPPMEAFHRGQMRIRAAKLGLASEFFGFLVSTDDAKKTIFIL